MSETLMKRERRTRWVVLSLGLLALPMAGLFPVANADAFGHLAQGRQIYELGRVPQLDSFSIATKSPKPWHNYEWLSDLASYALYRALGANGLVIAKCALLAAFVLLAYAVARRVSAELGAGEPAASRAAAACACLLLAVLPAVRFRLTERPHLVALPLLLLLLLALLRLTSRARVPSRASRIGWLAFVLITHALWVNLHGSHVLGLVTTACFVIVAWARAEDRALLRPLLAVLALQALASCASPYGPAIVLDAFEHLADPRYRDLVSEWRPWQPGDPPWLLLAPLLYTGLLAFAARDLARAGAVGRALALLSLVLCLAWARSIRFTAEYLLMTAPFVAAALSLRFAHFPSVRFERWLGALALGFALVAPWLSARLPPLLPIAGGVSLRHHPTASASWLEQQLPAPRLLAATDDAWFLMFALPKARFVIDGRIPFYGAAHARRVQLAIASPPHLYALLDELSVDTLMLRLAHEDHAAAHAAIRKHPRFGLTVIEDDHVTYVRLDARLRSGRTLEPLALEPSYDVGWLLSASAPERSRIERELERLPHSGSDGYRAWVRAMLELRPLLRGDGRSGLDPQRSHLEGERLARVARALERAAEGAQSVPIVHAYRAIVQIERCELDEAEASLELAEREGESRDTLLPRQELHLRRGERTAVKEFLEPAMRVPALARDPWILALRDQLASVKPCVER